MNACHSTAYIEWEFYEKNNNRHICLIYNTYTTAVSKGDKFYYNPSNDITHNIICFTT